MVVGNKPFSIVAGLWRCEVEGAQGERRKAGIVFVVVLGWVDRGRDESGERCFLFAEGAWLEGRKPAGRVKIGKGTVLCALIFCVFCKLETQFIEISD